MRLVALRVEHAAGAAEQRGAAEVHPRGVALMTGLGSRIRAARRRDHRRRWYGFRLDRWRRGLGLDRRRRRPGHDLDRRRRRLRRLDHRRWRRRGLVDRRAALFDALLRELDELRRQRRVLQVLAVVDDRRVARACVLVRAADLEQQRGILRQLVRGRVVLRGLGELADANLGLGRGVQLLGLGDLVLRRLVGRRDAGRCGKDHETHEQCAHAVDTNRVDDRI